MEAKNGGWSLDDYTSTSIHASSPETLASFTSAPDMIEGLAFILGMTGTDFFAAPRPCVVVVDQIDTEGEDELVTRTAHRWAWATVDETLALDAKSKSFSAELREDIQKAIDAMEGE